MNPSNQQEQIEPKFTYILEMKPSFPGNLFRFKEYNAPKVVAAFLLLISFIYFGWSFMGLLWNNHQSYSTLGTPNLWALPIRTLFVSLVQILHSTIDIFNVIIIATPLIITFFIAWIVFDPKNVAMYILSMTNVMFGFLEIFSPFDFVPDFLPVIGSVDDGILGGGLISYGVFLWFQAVKNKDKIRTVIELINDESEEKSLQLLLEQQGVSIKKVARN